MIGCGLLSASGIVHKRQRRVATPAFSIQNLRAFTPIVFERGSRLRNRWRDIIGKSGGDESVLDVCLWASRAAFDVVGAAGLCTLFLPRQFDANSASGFDYDFNSIEDDTNELFCAYREMFENAISQQRSSIRQLIIFYFPTFYVLFVSDHSQMTGMFLPYW